MAEYNETTAGILELVARRRMTTLEIAKTLGCSRSNVSTVLSKLLRSQRVERSLENPPTPVVLRKAGRGREAVVRDARVWRYGITDEGVRRLKFIRSGR